MARWQPDASERLVVAALDLFAERGYENTTVIEIAERAGLTKSTFFRHFPDKREVLFGGDVIDAVGRRSFTRERREFAGRRRAAIAASPELREREALKGLGLIATTIEALKARGVSELTASVAAELGALAWKIAFERWSETPGGDEFGEIARRTLGEVQAVGAAVLAADTQAASAPAPAPD
jgi:AcrR family transcriptional regulator